MPSYDTVIFDLDGTLLNTPEDLHGAVNHALAAMGRPECTVYAGAPMRISGRPRTPDWPASR